MKVIPLGEIHSDSNNSSKKILTPIIHDPTYQSSIAMSARVAGEDMKPERQTSNFWNSRSVAETNSGKKRTARSQERVRNSLYNVNVQETSEDNLESKILYDIHFQKSHKGGA